MLEPIQAPPPLQRARSLVLRWLISTLAIFVAVYLIPGIGFVGPGWELGIVAAVFGLVNAALRPLLTLHESGLPDPGPTPHDEITPEPSWVSTPDGVGNTDA